MWHAYIVLSLAHIAAAALLLLSLQSILRAATGSEFQIRYILVELQRMYAARRGN